MNEIRFKVELENVTIGELCEIQDNPKNISLLRNFMAHHLLNGDGSYMPEEQGRKRINAMSLLEFRDAQSQFGHAMEALQSLAVSPQIGGS